MSNLALACLAVLEDDCPPVTAESLVKILWATGHSPEGRPATEEEVDAAVTELMASGKIERIRRRGRAHYRAMHSEQVGYGSTRSS